MSAQTAIVRGRRVAEALMVDTCTIRRRTGEATDPESGQVTPTYATVYSGKCRLQQPTAQANEQDVGEATVLLLRFELQLPMSAVGVKADDEAVMDTSALDPDLPGREFVVRGLSHKSHAVMRRLQVEERTS